MPSVLSVFNIELILTPFSPFLLPPPPLLSHCDREAARPPQPNTESDGARVLCDACGGIGWWWVLPVVDMAVEIYNLCDFQST